MNECTGFVLTYGGSRVEELLKELVKTASWYESLAQRDAGTDYGKHCRSYSEGIYRAICIVRDVMEVTQ